MLAFIAVLVALVGLATAGVTPPAKPQQRTFVRAKNDLATPIYHVKLEHRVSQDAHDRVVWKHLKAGELSSNMAPIVYDSPSLNFDKWRLSFRSEDRQILCYSAAEFLTEWEIHNLNSGDNNQTNTVSISFKPPAYLGWSIGKGPEIFSSRRGLTCRFIDGPLVGETLDDWGLFACFGSRRSSKCTVDEKAASRIHEM